MTPAAFSALCELTRADARSPSMRAAALVLVYGRPATEAAMATGLQPQSVRNAVQRLRRARALALEVAK